MHQSFVSTPSPPPSGIMTFQSPGISPALWGQADGYNPALSPTLQNRKSHRGKGPNVKPPAIPGHCRDNKKVIALHLSPAIPVGGGGGGGHAMDTNFWCLNHTLLYRKSHWVWIQMFCVFYVYLLVTETINF